MTTTTNRTDRTGVMNGSKLATLTACVALGLASCGGNSSNPYAADSTPIQTVPPTPIDPSSLSIQDVASSVTIQVCIDTRTRQGVQYGGDVLSAVADALPALADLSGDDTRRGLHIEVWTTPDDAEGGGAVFDAVVPDVLAVEVPMGVETAEVNEALAAQAEQRRRIPAVEKRAAKIGDRLPRQRLRRTATSDIVRCISRANTLMAGRPAERRLLVIVSDFRLDAVSGSVRGDLRDTRQVLLLGWGDDLADRQRAWEPTWTSLGAESLRSLDVEDGLGGELAEMMKAVAR
jgi:hypothetical protein